MASRSLRLAEGGSVQPDSVPPRPDITHHDEGVGVSGNSDYQSLVMGEYLGKLRGVQGTRTYDKMRRSDAQVRGVLRLVKTPITAAEWYVQPASTSQSDRDIADFVSWNLFEAMERPWLKFLWESLSMMDFGFYPFELLWEWGQWGPNRERSRKKPVVYLKEFAPRHPISILDWKFDSHGRPIKMIQSAFSNLGYKEVEIDYQKLIVFTLDEETDNPEGVSILRSAYKHWYYKDNLYKVDAIQKERHGIGIPIVHLPVGYNPKDVEKAEEMGSNLRTNEKAFAVLPPNWELSMLKLEGNLVNALESAEHHDLMIARNVLGQFINLGSGEGSGSKAVGGTQMEIFVKAVRYVAGIIAQQINSDVVKTLVDWNFNGVNRYPELKVRRIGETVDWRGLSVALRNLIEPGLISPTPELETYVSDFMDLPLPSQEALDRDIDDRVTKGRGELNGNNPDQVENDKARRQEGGDDGRPTE